MAAARRWDVNFDVFVGFYELMRAEHLIIDPLEIRQDYKDLMNIMQLDDSSSEGSSSSDEDLDFLFLEAAFPEPRLLGPRLNMEDEWDRLRADI